MSTAQQLDAKWNDTLGEMRALHDQLNVELPQAPATEPTFKDATLQTLLDNIKADDFIGWSELHEIDLRLIGLMPDPLVGAQFASRRPLASAAGLASAAALETEFTKNGQTPDGRRAVLAELARAMQAVATLKRVNRRARKELTGKLNRLALGLFVGPVVVLALYLMVFGMAGAVGRVHLIVVVWFGIIGACMSRMIAIQGADIDYDDLVSGFSTWGVAVRLIFGGAAALLLYLMIAGHLLGGDIFPAKEFSVFTRKIPDGQGWLAVVPSIDFAKLLVWSAIAGFSERLVPEQFTRLQGTLNK
ncbi:hypothetical protein QO058_30265 (plasmid) [Bosea vestrisii]|uniref:hypothetical protein n=1 Tax=Bosea vestrisii TaxID=151416 RepID=UPI0024DF37F8|nr:hypothetical protein [Bosea vestrisii]WID99687.1 hypothetical protein QO058_30265 [Bosea vestrisii]